jgi:catechol 2,3-dioxygenase-like lactoylglutathione lyase family enzyme
MNTKNHPYIKTMSPLFVVANLEKSIAYYTQQLGFSIDFRYEDFYAGIIKDGCSIHLKLGSPNKEERVLRKEKEHIDLTFSVSQIDDFFAVVKTKGLNIIQPLREMPYGKEFYIADPDDYLLSFLEI